MTTERTTFTSDNDQVAAWVTLPAGKEPFPVVLLIHGGGATHAMILSQYEQAFSQAGFAVVAFDFRGLGESEGQPRQLMSVRKYLQDIESALTFIREQPQLDATRVALWGTSFGSSHVIATAARHPEIAAAIIQCPVLSGRALAFRSGVGNLLGLTIPIIKDLIAALFGRERYYVPIVGKPNERAYINRPGAYDGWYSVAPKGSGFENRTPAASGIGLLFYNAISKASQVGCPLFVCVSDKEDLVSPDMAVQAANAAPKGEYKHYPADHFTVYHPPLAQQIIADQIAFLKKYLTHEKATH